MGGAEAGGPETSSHRLGTVANPGLSRTCQKCGQCDYCPRLKRRQMGERHSLDADENHGASPSMFSKCFQVP